MTNPLTNRSTRVAVVKFTYSFVQHIMGLCQKYYREGTGHEAFDYEVDVEDISPMFDRIPEDDIELQGFFSEMMVFVRFLAGVLRHNADHHVEFEFNDDEI